MCFFFPDVGGVIAIDGLAQVPSTWGQQTLSGYANVKLTKIKLTLSYKDNRFNLVCPSNGTFWAFVSFTPR